MSTTYWTNTWLWKTISWSWFTFCQCLASVKLTSDIDVLEMRCGSEVWMTGFPGCHQPLNITCHPSWKRIDIPQCSVQKNLGSGTGLYTNMCISIFSLFRSLSSLTWRIPSRFWRSKIQRPKKSFMELSVIRTSHLKVENMMGLYVMIMIQSTCKD